MIEMQNKKESKLKEFVILTLIPWYLIYKLFDKKIFGILAACLSIFISFFLWGILLIDDNNIDSYACQIYDLNSHINELNNDISDKEIEIKKLNNKIDNLNEKQEDKKDAEEKKNESIKKKSEYSFSSGNYISGKDFSPGVYDIVVVSGDVGNVISSNMFNGGINAVMGTMADTEKEYKNIELPKNIKLEIKGIKVKLISKS